MKTKVLDKMYSKKDIYEELKISSYALNLKLEKLEKFYNIDFKHFHNFNGEEKNNQYTFNGISKELLIVLLKNIDNLPLNQSNNKKSFNTNDINGAEYIKFIRGIMKDIDKIDILPLKIDIISKDIFQNTLQWLQTGDAFEQKLQEIYSHMNQFSVEKKIELQKQIFKAIDETIYNFHLQEYVEQRKTVDSEIPINKKAYKKVQEIDYDLYEKSLIPIDSPIESSQLFETTEYKSIDLLIVKMLINSKFVDNPALEIEKKYGAQNKNRELKRTSINALAKMTDNKLMHAGKTYDYDEFLREYLLRMSSHLVSRKEKLKSFSYVNKIYAAEKKSSILKKIKIMKFYRRRANQNVALTEQILKTKYELEKLHSFLIYNKMNFSKSILIPKEYFMYMIEDINLILKKIDGYIDPEIVSKYYPNIQMKITNRPIVFTKRYLKIQRKIIEELSKNIPSNNRNRIFHINIITNSYKKELENFRTSNSQSNKEL
ncbi:DUF6038 family protein [Macrococcoides caseolyticum]|uniref:DUF6038 family protein n=1 Tax=Macrococcoides caseolyticum TaxID=69966 RepID=UPI000C346FFF|nr:DUF6038 family protein [Macrococcus caseolyticus]PKE50751.1 hypothetical protein CW672_04495 [Macrococcus caseolyticus]